MGKLEDFSKVIKVVAELTGGLGCELSVQYDASMIPYMYYEIGLRYSLLK